MTTSGWVYVAFIVDVYSQQIVTWYAQTAKGVELVRIPLRLTLWERRRGAHQVDRDRLNSPSTRRWDSPVRWPMRASARRSARSETRRTMR